MPPSPHPHTPTRCLLPREPVLPTLRRSHTIPSFLSPHRRCCRTFTTFPQSGARAFSPLSALTCCHLMIPASARNSPTPLPALSLASPFLLAASTCPCSTSPPAQHSEVAGKPLRSHRRLAKRHLATSMCASMSCWGDAPITLRKSVCDQPDATSTPPMSGCLDAGWSRSHARHSGWPDRSRRCAAPQGEPTCS